MFCNQCEQTNRGKGCEKAGVCGKKAEVADMQDALVAQLRELAHIALLAREKGIADSSVDDFAVKALFSTLTNVNFDPEAFRRLQATTLRHAQELAKIAGCAVPADVDAMLAGHATAITDFAADEDVRSAMQLLLYGLKGVAAYADHAAELGQRDPDVAAFLYRGLVAGSKNDTATRDLGGWLELALECGKVNLRAMELLEKGNIAAFGSPSPARVSLGHRKGKAILISGHDLRDLKALLDQTAGLGINVYTHGEMLPAHGYPQLRAYAHLAGHFGTAWQNQQKELPEFPGAVLFTTNCIQNPRGYEDRVFTCGNVGWPGLTHCDGRDFSAVIRKAQELPGFAEDAPGREVVSGLGREAVLSVAPKVLEAAKSGKLRHIFLVGGCDGARPGRNYYTELVEKIPADCLVLTLACGKFRFFDKDLGELEGLPRLIDMGQCNDAYGAIQVAVALAQALRCGVNDLPLSLILSWYEQKAVSILLTLLALDVKNIRIGPSLPAFISPNILNVLVEKWHLTPISAADEDLKAILG